MPPEPESTDRDELRDQRDRYRRAMIRSNILRAEREKELNQYRLAFRRIKSILDTLNLEQEHG